MRRLRHTGRLWRWDVSSRPRGREGHHDGQVDTGPRLPRGGDTPHPSAEPVWRLPGPWRGVPPAPQCPGRRMADAHHRRFPGVLRQRAASLGRTIALRSGGAFKSGLATATTVTDDGVWEGPRDWGWWMQDRVGHHDVAPDDRFARRRP